MDEASIYSLDYKALQQACKSHNLKAIGKKEVLVERLLTLIKPKTDELTEIFGNLDLSKKVNRKDTSVSGLMYKPVNLDNMSFENYEALALYTVGKLLFEMQSLSATTNNDFSDICVKVESLTGISRYKCYDFACSIWTMFLDDIKNNPDKSPESIFKSYMETADEMLPTFQTHIRN